MAYSGWSFRRELTDANATSLSDHMVLVELDNTNFDFANADADGADIRFAQGATELPYWIESYDSGGETAEIWVRVPDTSAAFHIYYGNAAAESESDIRATFLIGEDWSEYPRGYEIGPRGIVSIDSCKIGSTLFMSTVNWSGTFACVLYRSTDGGRVWSSLSTPWAGGAGREAFYIDSDGVDTIYATAKATSGATVFKRSGDSGATWGSEVQVVATASNDPKVLRVSGTGSTATLLCYVFVSPHHRVYRSTDGGDTWAHYGTLDSSVAVSAEDTHAIVAPNGDILYALEFEVAEGGHSGDYQYRSTDGGLTWGSRTEIYDNGVFGSATGADTESGSYVIRPDGTTLDYIFATNEDVGSGSYTRNVIKRMTSTDSGVNWTGPVTLSENWGNIEVLAQYNDDDELVVIATHGYASGGTQGITQIVAYPNALPATFNYSDGGWTQTEGAPWIADIAGVPALTICGYTATGTRAFFVNDTTLPTDVVIDARMQGPGADFRFAFRYNDINNHYMAHAASTGMNLFERAAGTYTAIDTDAATISANTWYDLQIRAVGSSLQMYINGVLRPSATDATLTGGTVAMTAAATTTGRLGALRVRPHAATEPDITVGSEEANESSALLKMMQYLN